MKLAKWATNDLAFLKETAADFFGRIPWLGIALAMITAAFFAAPWLAN